MSEPLLTGRVVVVTGAAGSLGPAVVAAAGAAGARVIAVGRDAARLAALGVEHRAADLTDLPATRALAAELGGVDCVLHLVGGYRANGPIGEIEDADWDALAQPLLRTTLNVTRAFAGALAASAHGRFVLVSSNQAQAPTAAGAVYAATKAAAEAWTLALADELGKGGSGATANILVVKAIVTPAMREAKPDAPFAIFTPAEDAAQALVFLCSDAGRKMNGKRLPLHG